MLLSDALKASEFDREKGSVGLAMSCFDFSCSAAAIAATISEKSDERASARMGTVAAGTNDEFDGKGAAAKEVWGGRRLAPHALASSLGRPLGNMRIRL